MNSAKTAMLWLAVVGVGIAAGLWMASMTYYCEFCLFAPHRFAAWQCCVAGSVLSVAAFGVGIGFQREFLPATVAGIRRAGRFLFEDLA